MRSDQRGAPCELVAPTLRERARKASSSARRRRAGQTFGCVAHAQLVAGEVRRTPRRRAGPAARPPRARACGRARRRPAISSSSQASMPAGAPAPSHSFSSRLRWRSAAVVGGEQSFLERPQRDHRLVEERAALRRVADHDRQVERAEQHRAHLAPQVALAPHRRSVDLHPARAPARGSRPRPAPCRSRSRTRLARRRRRPRRCTSAALAETRGDPSAYSTWMPSSRFVLPSPLGPTNDREPVGQLLELGVLVVAELDAARPTPGASRAGSARARDQETAAGRRTGITRYVNSSPSPRTTPGFSPSRTSSRTLSPVAARSPSARYCGLNATVRSSPS